jgi:hypothetical protein
MTRRPQGVRGRHRAAWFVAVLALVVVLGAAALPRIEAFFTPASPPVGPGWSTVLTQIRALEHRIGFRPTENFARLATELTSYPFCGRASNRRLPYSYQDRLIEWPEIEQEAQCLQVDADTDAYYDEVEAWGEIRTPVTTAMIDGKLDRFVYLVLHEDCHDQYDLPYGIEEPLCDVLTHRAMTQFARERYRWHDVERRSINRYARTEPRSARITIRYYHELEQLYARYEQGRLSHARLLEMRAGVFRAAEDAMDIAEGQLNSIVFANYMTYSRHYPAIARIVDGWGDDLAGAVAFFRLVDARKPGRESVAKRLGVEDEREPVFLRGYEEAVLATARAMSGTDASGAR